MTNEMTDKRLIEVAFPLKQVSLDSVHEKNVRHGHISTPHIWPARAALIATLLADPGMTATLKSRFPNTAPNGLKAVAMETPTC